MRWTLAAAAAAVVLTAVGCGSEEEAPPSATGFLTADGVSITVETEGGSATLNVPASAVTEDVEITLRILEDEDDAPVPLVPAVALEVTPSVDLLQPAEIVASFGEEEIRQAIGPPSFLVHWLALLDGSTLSGLDNSSTSVDVPNGQIVVRGQTSRLGIFVLPSLVQLGVQEAVSAGGDSDFTADLFVTYFACRTPATIEVDASIASAVGTTLVNAPTFPLALRTLNAGESTGHSFEHACSESGPIPFDVTLDFDLAGGDAPSMDMGLVEEVELALHVLIGCS